LSLYLTKHHAMKTYWGSGGIASRFLTSALDGGEWSVSLPGRFTPRERTADTHWIGGRVGPRAVLDAVVKRKIPSLRRESNPTMPIVQFADRVRFANYRLRQNLQAFEVRTLTIVGYKSMELDDAKHAKDAPRAL
jgi:hypothetical protein